MQTRIIVADLECASMRVGTPDDHADGYRAGSASSAADALPGAPIARELRADDIRWDLAALPELPPMSPTDQAVDAIVDGISFRLLALEAIDQLRERTIQLDRAREEIRRLREAARA